MGSLEELKDMLKSPDGTQADIQAISKSALALDSDLANPEDWLKDIYV